MFKRLFLNPTNFKSKIELYCNQEINGILNEISNNCKNFNSTVLNTFISISCQI